MQPGFTLIELLVVITIIGLLLALLFPVFALVKEAGHSNTCLSNERQVGVALLQYAQDADETLPSGTQGSSAFNANGVPLPGGNGAGWAGQVFPYVKSTALFQCPSEGPFTGIAGLRNVPGALSAQGVVVSYGYNSVLPRQFPLRSIGGRLDRVIAPAEMVLLFEVSGCKANITVPRENQPPGTKVHSAAGQGSVNPTVDRTGMGNLYGVRYATGNLAGQTPEPKAEYSGVVGRHRGGANYVLVDGHARWLRPDAVLPGGLRADFPKDGYTASFTNRVK